jgi:hypothetical protein
VRIVKTGCTILGMGKKSFVYVGLKGGPQGGFYVKIGKSNNPVKRMAAYFTHIPGGLLSMYAAIQDSEHLAFSVENQIFNAMGSIHSCRHAGGEWHYVAGESLHIVFEKFEKIAGKAERVELKGPYAFRPVEYFNWELS